MQMGIKSKERQIIFGADELYHPEGLTIFKMLDLMNEK